MPTPMVTIAMPCLNEADYIEGCIDSVLAQDYPRDRIEVIVADGGSTDGTRAIVERIAARDPRVKMIDNPDRIQAPAMNRIIAAARGDVIIRMDVHCEYALSYVRKCVEVLERTGADNVGGAQRARGRTRFQRAVCAALSSPLGVGGAKYRDEDQEGFVDTVFLGAWRRAVFERVGLYDPKAVTNEDAELNQRILASGGKIYLSKEIVVHYYPRNSWSSLARQYFKYGQGRARTLLKHRRFPTLRPVVPFLMTTAGAALLATSNLQPFTAPAFGLYALATGIEAVRVGLREGVATVPVVWAIFPVLHVSHGVGFAAGLIRYARRRDWGEEARLEEQRLRAVA
jgi:glycosyltransferase involved in cell wall biosynthesis